MILFEQVGLEPVEEIHQPESVRYESQLDDELQVEILLIHEFLTKQCVPLRGLLFRYNRNQFPKVFILCNWNNKGVDQHVKVRSSHDTDLLA
jgi:hypothetical protein